MANRNVVVIGGSAGALGALELLLEAVPNNLKAALFVVVHVQPSDENWLPTRIKQCTALPVLAPKDEPIQNGRIYVGMPDCHLMLDEHRVYATRGPRENLWRPAIDVLFRSAAVAHKSRVIGVVLSGELDDGTSGLQAIKTCGGLAVVQNPATAAYPTMPEIAITNVNVDHCVDVNELGALITGLVGEQAPPAPEIPQRLFLDSRMANDANIAISAGADSDPPTALSCPDCDGPLWSRDTEGNAYHRQVGHAYDLNSLAKAHDDQLDSTLWAAIRLFEQRANIAQAMSEESRGRGLQRRADIHALSAAESKRHAQRLRELQAAHSSPEEPLHWK